MRRFLEQLRPFAPVFLRIVLAILFIYYGQRHLLSERAVFFKRVTEDMHLPPWSAHFAAWSELAGGVLLGAGFLTRLAALACAAVAAGFAVKMKLHSGFSGGLELPLLTLAACLSLLFSGAGRLSLDRRLFGGP